MSKVQRTRKMVEGKPRCWWDHEGTRRPLGIKQQRQLRAAIKLIRRAWIVQHGYRDFSRINRGDCDQFADAITDFLRFTLCLKHHRYALVEGEGHFWVFVGGRHYDAEAPNGVKQWRRLPIYRDYEPEDEPQ